MAGEGVIIFIIIILLIAFLILSFIYEQSKKRAVVTFFIKRGCIQQRADELKFKDKASGITYEVEKFHRGAGKNRRAYYRLSTITPSDFAYKFTITKRGGLSKLFGVNKGVFHDLDDFNVSTTHPQQVLFLLTENVVYKLDSLFRFARSLEVDSQSGLQVIEVEMRYNNGNLFSTVDIIEFLSQQLLTPDLLEGVEVDEYICFSCNAEISFFGDYCSNCGVIAPKCIICFEDPEPNEDVILFSCCRSYAHRKHALTWIKKKNICPSCRVERPELRQIKEII
ncbi:MAG: hypothetical protein ACXAB7_12900 [Candidatus Kariarchaeaceae archaeon]|jgi:hypothetical protein